MITAVSVHSFFDISNMLNARLSDSLGQFSESSIEERLAENAELRALYIDRELSVIGEDVRFLSNTLSNKYNPRKVAELREIEDVYAGEPYIMYSPALFEQGIILRHALLR